MCLSVKHDPKGCSGHTRLRNTEVINSFAELIRAFTMLGNTQREQFVVFPKHNCVGVSFVFHFYLIHSEPFLTYENVERMEQLELSPTIGENQNGPATLGNFGKLGNLL